MMRHDRESRERYVQLNAKRGWESAILLYINNHGRSMFSIVQHIEDKKRYEIGWRIIKYI